MEPLNVFLEGPKFTNGNNNKKSKTLGAIMCFYSSAVKCFLLKLSIKDKNSESLYYNKN